MNIQIHTVVMETLTSRQPVQINTHLAFKWSTACLCDAFDVNKPQHCFAQLSDVQSARIYSLTHSTLQCLVGFQCICVCPASVISCLKRPKKSLF